jgi:hypothetical protein
LDLYLSQQRSLIGSIAIIATLAAGPFSCCQLPWPLPPYFGRVPAQPVDIDEGMLSAVNGRSLTSRWVFAENLNHDARQLLALFI